MTTRSFLSRAIATAQRTGGPVEDAIGLMETLGPGIAAAGVSPDEALALAASMGETTGRKRAVTAVRGILEAIGKGVDIQTGGRHRTSTGAWAPNVRHVSFAGQGLAGGLAAMQAQAPEAYAELMASPEAALAARIIRGGRFAGDVGAIRRAGETGAALEESLGTELAGNRAVRELRQQQARAEIAAERRGRAGAEREALRLRVGTALEEGGYDPLSRAAVRGYMGLQEFWSPRTATQEFRGIAYDVESRNRRAAEANADPTAKEILAELRKQTALAERTSAPRELRDPARDDQEGRR